MSKVTITYEFESPIEDYDIESILRAREYRRILQDVDEELRQALKHNDAISKNMPVFLFLERLRLTIAEVPLYE